MAFGTNPTASEIDPLRLTNLVNNLDELQSKNIPVNQLFTIIEQSVNRIVGDLRHKEYMEKLHQPKVYPVYTSDEFLRLIILKAKHQIKWFHLDSSEMEVYQLLSMYFTGDAQFEQKGYSLSKGLLLYGNVGCGKTTAMELFRSNQVKSYVITSCRTVAYDYSMNGGYAVLDKYVNDYDAAPSDFNFGKRKTGICFDDLGTENEAQNFGNRANVMADIILNRYDIESRQGVFSTHMTTNLGMKEISQEYGTRVADRIKEMFNVIEYPKVPSKRK